MTERNHKLECPEDYQSLRELYEDLWQKNQDLLQAKQKAETAVAAKTEFLANMSHDLRTPLHAILSYSRFGIDKIEKIDKSKIIKYFRNIEESGKKLQEMLNKIVDLSKLESGKMSFQMYSINLSLVVQSLLKENQGILQTKKIKVDTSIPEHTSPVHCDQNKITQVMNSLFKNLLYHSPEGDEVRIAIEEEHPAGYMKISFKDRRTDPLSVEIVENFDAYIEKIRIKTGTDFEGIGLAIAYEIIKHHNGQLTARNRKNGGVEYSFTLPFHQNETN